MDSHFDYCCRSLRISVGQHILLMAVVSVSTSVYLPSSSAADNSDNAALQYWIAFSLCPPETRVISNATSDDETVGFGIPVSQKLAESFQGDGAKALEYLHRGTKLSSCEWGTDLRRDGPRVAVPYGEKAHALARISLLRSLAFRTRRLGRRNRRHNRHDDIGSSNLPGQVLAQHSFRLHDRRYVYRHGSNLLAQYSGKTT